MHRVFCPITWGDEPVLHEENAPFAIDIDQFDSFGANRVSVQVSDQQLRTGYAVGAGAIPRVQSGLLARGFALDRATVGVAGEDKVSRHGLALRIRQPIRTPFEAANAAGSIHRAMATLTHLGEEHLNRVDHSLGALDECLGLGWIIPRNLGAHLVLEGA